MGHELGAIVAERVLRRSGSTKSVTVRLGTPRKAEAIDWQCPYQIIGLRGSRVEVAYGVDAVQALQLALEAIRIRLGRYSKEWIWEGGDGLYGGFPRAVPSSFGRDFAVGIEQYIDAETARMLKAAQARTARRQTASRSERERSVRVGTNRTTRTRSGGRIRQKHPR